MSDRVFAVLWLAFCAFIAWVGWKIEAPFSYEPIGPRAFPLLLTAGMAASAAWLLIRPDAAPDWPNRALLVKLAVLLGSFLAYAVVFEWLGFPLSTAIVTIVIGRLFGGGWLAVAIGGAGMGGGLWFFFDRILDVTLPLGRVFTGA